MSFDYSALFDRPKPPDMTDRDALFEAFCELGRHQVYSWDIDPTYPVLRAVYDAENVGENDRLWRTFLYVAFYNLGSAYRVWSKYPSPTLPDLEDLRQPTGVERRGFRGQPHLVHLHLKSALDLTGGDFKGWVDSYGTGYEGWNNARNESKRINHIGDWAAYKWADLLSNTHSLPIDAPDFGVGGKGQTAGPIPGMVLLTGADWKRCAEDMELQQSFYERCMKAGVPFRGLDQVETCLCDFNSLAKGRYYVGHDCDAQMDHFKSGDVPQVFWDARSAIPVEYRGELNGWFGPDHSRKSCFSRTGEIIIREKSS